MDLQANIDLDSINPLDVPHIIERIIYFLPDDEARNCRLISKCWRSEAGRILHSRDRVIVSTDQDVKDILGRFSQNPEYRISSIMFRPLPPTIELLTNFLTKVRYEISRLGFVSGIVSQQTYEQLFRLIGENVVNFTIGDIRSAPTLELLRFFPVRDLETDELIIHPKMKSLTYVSRNFPIQNSSYMSYAARMFPNLTVLNIFNIPTEDPEIFQQIRLPNLRYLFLKQVPNDIPRNNLIAGLLTNHIECLNMLQLNLTELIFENISNSIDINVLKTFLESQKSLKRLRLAQKNLTPRDENNQIIKIEGNDFSQIPGPIIFPLTLASIQFLQIMKPYVTSLNHVFVSCPNILRLDCLFHVNTNWSQILTKKHLRPPASLESLHIWWINAASLARLCASKLNQQIIHFSLKNCDPSLMRIIFSKLPNLRILEFTEKSLTVFGEAVTNQDYITDESISGISKSTLIIQESLYEKTKNDGGNLNQIVQGFGKLRTKPYIGNLKHLSSLKITISNSCPVKSIHLWGMEDLSKLSRLILIGKKFTPMIDCVMEDLGFTLLTSDKVNGFYSFVRLVDEIVAPHPQIVEYQISEDQ